MRLFDAFEPLLVVPRLADDGCDTVSVLNFAVVFRTALSTEFAVPILLCRLEFFGENRLVMLHLHNGVSVRHGMDFCGEYKLATKQLVAVRPATAVLETDVSGPAEFFRRGFSERLGDLFERFLLAGAEINMCYTVVFQRFLRFIEQFF